MEIYLMRHGETEWNRQRRLQGRADIPLNDTGLAEARKAARALANVKFDRIFSSPLQRARKTAEIIRGESGPAVTTEPLLIEISFGAGEGIRVHEVALGGAAETTEAASSASQENAVGAAAGTKPAEQEALRQRMLAFFEDPGNYRPVEGGESIPEIKERAAAFLDKLRPLETECARVLIVAHGGIIRAILDVIEELPDAAFWSGALLPNCGAAVAELRDGRYSVRGVEALLKKDTVQS